MEVITLGCMAMNKVLTASLYTAPRDVTRAAALHAEIDPEIQRQAARAREAEAATVSLTDRIARIEAFTRRGR